MGGYKQMLRDRMPEILDVALTYCKAKNRWIDYVYKNSIKKYPQNKRSVAVKVLLGLKQQYKRKEIYDKIKYAELKPITKEQVDSIPKSELYIKFKQTIDFGKLAVEDKYMYKYWSDVCDWVDWFSKSYFSIKDTYQNAKKWHMSDHEIKVMLMNKYSIDNRAVDHLIKTF